MELTVFWRICLPVHSWNSSCWQRCEWMSAVYAAFVVCQRWPMKASSAVTLTVSEPTTAVCAATAVSPSPRHREKCSALGQPCVLLPTPGDRCRGGLRELDESLLNGVAHSQRELYFTGSCEPLHRWDSSRREDMRNTGLRAEAQTLI